ncbi:MAG: hypothetical protein ABSH20_23485 [Tepidisphaeraceae bacterium]|jgi:hypothetical protein
MKDNPIVSTVAAALIATACSTTVLAQTPPPTPAEVAHEARQREQTAESIVAELELSKRLLDRLIADATTTVGLLQTLGRESEALARRLDKLPENDEGKRLASTLDPLSAKDLIKMMSTPPVEPAALAATQKQAEALLQQLKDQRERVVAGYVPPDALVAELKGLTKWAHRGQDEIKEMSGWIDQQLLGVPAGFDSSKAPTLRDTLLALRRHEANNTQTNRTIGFLSAKPEGDAAMQTTARIIALEKAVQDAKIQLEAARADLVTERGEHQARMKTQYDQFAQKMADLERKLAQSEVARKLQNAQTQGIQVHGQEEAEYAAKRLKALSPRVRQVLTIFMAPGYFQPPHKISIDKEPVSLASLREVGALERNEKGLNALIIVAITDDDRERPRWGFKTLVRDLRGDQLEFVKEAQKYLIEYGPILVKEGLLAQ